MMKIIAISLVVGLASSVGFAAPNDYIKSSGKDKNYIIDKSLDIEEMNGFITDNNLEVVRRATDHQGILEKTLGSAFAGTWIEYDDNKNAYQVVAITRPTNIDKSIFLGGKYKIINATYNIKYLDELMERVVRIYAPKNIGDETAIYGAGVNVKINRVVINVKKELVQKFRDNLVLNGFDLGAIIIDDKNNSVTLYDTLYGGMGIVTNVIPSGSGGMRCTAGFNAYRDIYPLMITAGHCGFGNNSGVAYFDLGSPYSSAIYGSLIGQYLSNDFNNGMDLAVVANANFVHYQPPLVKNGPSTTRSVYSTMNPIVGSYLSTYGNSNGLRAGQVLGVNQLHITNGVAFRQVDVQFCGGGGDSGGPVVNAYGNAVAIYIGGLNQAPATTQGNCGGGFGGSGPASSAVEPLTQLTQKYSGLTVRTP